MRQNGAEFKGHKSTGKYSGLFIFDSDRSEQDWKLEYMNSCCCKHDAEVMNLRKFINGS